MKPLRLALLLLLIAGIPGCTQTQSTPAAADTGTHPMNPLAPDEYEATISILKDASVVDENTLFQTITLKEMPKADVLAWQPNDPISRSAYVVFKQGQEWFEGVVDITGRQVTVPFKKIEDAQPAFLFEEIMDIAQKVTVEDAEWQAAMNKRGITDYGNVFCLPLSVGYFGAEEEEDRRLMRVPCTFLEGSTTNMFGRPIGGVFAVVDLDEERVIRIIDTGVVSLPESASNYDEASVGPLRKSLKPVKIQTLEGPNYTVEGNVVTWQDWRFHFRMDRRAGLIVSNATFNDGDQTRSVLYQGHASELFVPYMDGTEEFYWRTFLDYGEYGAGLLASPLVAGPDCPETATFFSAHVQLFGDGKPHEVPDLVCLFERPAGYPIWRHGEINNETHESRPKVDLVLRMAAVVGNYDYIFDWVFTQHGWIEIGVGATGIDLTKAVNSTHLSDATAAEDTRYGTLIAPNLVAPNHDHFINFRLDLDVDGPINAFKPGRLTTKTLDSSVPRKSVWVWDNETVAEREADARMKISQEQPMFWRVVNPEKTNAMGYETSYALTPAGYGLPMMVPDDYPQLYRGGFTNYNLWVTPYEDHEIFAAGDFPNQNKKVAGLPAWTEANRSIKDTDIVLWYNVAFRHVPMAEDWPVMPTMWQKFVLRPVNFFDRNPTINMPM